MKVKKHFFITLLIICLIPFVIMAGSVIFKDKYYAWVIACVAVISLIPLLLSFEKEQNTSKELAVIAAMVALSSIGRFVFAWLPGFKPVTAITVISAVYLGKESGFIIGCMSALISNFYFGQGPWTPFQMFAWGLIGYFAGLVKNPIKKSKVIMCLYGAVSGAAFSLTMDIWTTLWIDGYFNFSRYGASVITSIPIMLEYIISNIIFLIILAKPIGEKLDRIKTKYGLFTNKKQG